MDSKTFLKSVSHLCSEMSHEKRAGFMEAMSLLHDLNRDAAEGALASALPKDIRKSQAMCDIVNLPESIKKDVTPNILGSHINSIKLDITADLERYLNKNEVGGEKYKLKTVAVREFHVTVFLLHSVEMQEPDEDFYSDEMFDDFLLSVGNKYGCWVSVCSAYFSK